jgi:hypothetical protein
MVCQGAAAVSSTHVYQTVSKQPLGPPLGFCSTNCMETSQKTQVHILYTCMWSGSGLTHTLAHPPTPFCHLLPLLSLHSPLPLGWQLQSLMCSICACTTCLCSSDTLLSLRSPYLCTASYCSVHWCLVRLMGAWDCTLGSHTAMDCCCCCCWGACCCCGCCGGGGEAAGEGPRGGGCCCCCWGGGGGGEALTKLAPGAAHPAAKVAAAVA